MTRRELINFVAIAPLALLSLSSRKHQVDGSLVLDYKEDLLLYGNDYLQNVDITLQGGSLRFLGEHSRVLNCRITQTQQSEYVVVCGDVYQKNTLTGCYISGFTYESSNLLGARA